jgi:hypothetical protein
MVKRCKPPPKIETGYGPSQREALPDEIIRVVHRVKRKGRLAGRPFFNAVSNNGEIDEYPMSLLFCNF